MKIKILLEELDKLGIPKDKMAITSSGPLGIRNLREINDLDIIVLPEVWSDLVKKYDVTKEDNFESIYIGNVQVLGEGSWFTDPKLGSVEEDIKNADVINGYRYVKLDKILKIKRLKDREKDIKDVKIIEEYMKK
ncbi:MAG TPA: hypothetical protein VF185_00700 [Patescibacteria group bacterium]